MVQIGIQCAGDSAVLVRSLRYVTVRFHGAAADCPTFFPKHTTLCEVIIVLWREFVQCASFRTSSNIWLCKIYIVNQKVLRFNSLAVSCMLLVWMVTSQWLEKVSSILCSSANLIQKNILMHPAIIEDAFKLWSSVPTFYWFFVLWASEDSERFWDVQKTTSLCLGILQAPPQI